MKTIIAGSRSITNINILQQALEKIDWKITEVVSGGARGADYLGEVYARDFGIPIKRFLAEWNRYGKSAGYKRNLEMAQYSDALIALWDGESRGTKHMIDLANTNHLKILIHLIK